MFKLFKMAIFIWKYIATYLKKYRRCENTLPPSSKSIEDVKIHCHLPQRV